MPYLADSIVYFMRGMASRRAAEDESETLDNFLPGDYVDPLTKEACVAAFAPVIVAGRPASQRDTGWFVIVQQKAGASPDAQASQPTAP